MRRAQALLDEMRAERSRTLAAFAVAVGDDGSIADLMGLNEREVRLARRTVGRSTARSIAEKLLGRSSPAAGPTPSGPAAAPEGGAPDEAAPRPAGPAAAVPPAPVVPPMPAAPPAAAGTPALNPAPAHARAPVPVTPQMPQPHQPHQSAPVPQASPVPQPAQGEPVNAAAWSSSMDSVLLWSWESGLDLHTVAAELGLDVRTLLMRVQELANDGLLTLATPVAETGRSGRHRRHHHEEGYAALFSPTATFPTHVPY
ncbi:hypothetical protein ABT097_26560 [Streptomyces sp. NPDC002225]|uniref:hypothetical protein n=1 Tax=Streptomyces sp. NPDC002225 TaxID=3154413 RepID=UPI00333349FE